MIGRHAGEICGSTPSKRDSDRNIDLGDKTVDPGVSKYMALQLYGIYYKQLIQGVLGSHTKAYIYCVGS